MSFKPLNEIPTHEFRRNIIANSETMYKNEAILGDVTNTKSVSGAGGTTKSVLGVSLAIEGKGGNVLELESVTVASTNYTVAQTQVVWVPSLLPIIYEADLDDTIGTTSGSTGFGYFTLSSSDLLLDESTYTTTDRAGQFYSYGQSPNGGNKVVGRFIADHAL